MQEDTDITAVAEGNMVNYGAYGKLNFPESVEVCHAEYWIEIGFKNS